MASPRPQCEDHADLVAALATERERARSLEQAEDRLTAAILVFDQRLRKIELNLAKWGGVVAAIAALPLAWQIISWIIDVAEASQ